jgi:hypothetical protein
MGRIPVRSRRGERQLENFQRQGLKAEFDSVSFDLDGGLTQNILWLLCAIAKFIP